MRLKLIHWSEPQLRILSIILSLSTEGVPIYRYQFCPQIIVCNTKNLDEQSHQVHVVSSQYLLPSIRTSPCPESFFSFLFGITAQSLLPINTGLVVLSIIHRFRNISDPTHSQPHTHNPNPPTLSHSKSWLPSIYVQKDIFD